MPQHLIQDDIIRRALNFFGLRGVVQHLYEATVLPTVIIGDLGSPQIYARAQNDAPTEDIWLVPPGETWRPILMGGILAQTAGTVLPRWQLLFLSASGAAFASIPLPTTFQNGSTFTASSLLGFTAITLNTSTNFTTIFRQGFLMGPGSRIQISAAPGDGTVVIDGQSILIYEKLGERLVELQG